MIRTHHFELIARVADEVGHPIVPPEAVGEAVLGGMYLARCMETGLAIHVTGADELELAHRVAAGTWKTI